MGLTLVGITLAAWIAAPAPPAPSGQEASDGDDAVLISRMWRSYAHSLPAGSKLAVELKDGRRLKVTLLAVREDELTLRPRTRVPEPDLTINTDAIADIERDEVDRTARPPLPVPGDRVRVSADDMPSRIAGTVASFDPDNLSLFIPGHQRLVVLPRSRLKTVAISRGNVSVGRRAAKGAARGFLAGMAAGMLASFIWSPCLSDPGRCDRTFGDKVLVGGILGGVFDILTVPLGTLIGAATPAVRWEAVPPKKLQVAVAPRRRGAAINLRVAF
jgi:hypothetical protein